MRKLSIEKSFEEEEGGEGVTILPAQSPIEEMYSSLSSLLSRTSSFS